MMFSLVYAFIQGEKLLGTLGGLFSKTWKPNKNRKIKGPLPTKGKLYKYRGSYLSFFYALLVLNKSTDDSFARSNQLERQDLGLAAPVPRSKVQHFSSEPASALEKVEVLIVSYLY